MKFTLILIYHPKDNLLPLLGTQVTNLSQILCRTSTHIRTKQHFGIFYNLLHNLLKEKQYALYALYSFSLTPSTSLFSLSKKESQKWHKIKLDWNKYSKNPTNIQKFNNNIKFSKRISLENLFSFRKIFKKELIYYSCKI